MLNLEDTKMTFQGENSWMVQCLSLAAVALLGYMHIAPVVFGVT
ncbi:MAG: hypothetical protein ACI9BF_000903 [Candidatus Paceibacteria bacterium]|jgi:hypothetical protein